MEATEPRVLSGKVEVITENPLRSPFEWLTVTKYMCQR
jgi:hypothetical protein